ncbi:MAG TPA: hypothetical protein VHU14_03425 [Solirubrobacterales bacterium]|jgi:DNA anti-recombination protein RmuC|nr:hypothetical protein [Solirubrobacterales bacterium]
MEEATKVNWNDDRIDRFAEQVDRRFDKVDERFDRVDERFERMEERMERRFDSLQHAMIITMGGFIAAFAALFASVNL